MTVQHGPLKILQVSPFLPFPTDSGGKLVAFHYFAGLAARGHRMTIVAPLRRPGDAASAAEMRGYGEVVLTAVPRRTRASLLPTVLSRGESFRVARHRFREVEASLRRVVRPGSHDVALIDSLFTAYLIPIIRDLAPAIRVVLLQHNVESLLVRRYARLAGPLVRVAGWVESERLLRAERAALEGANRVIALSGTDRDELKKICPRARVSVVPPGVRTYPGAEIEPPAHPRRCLFLGSYRWAPNREAARWLLEDVFPRVLTRVPDAELALAGEAPTREIRSFAGKRCGVRVLGHVADAAAAVRSSAVSMAPIRVGSGIRLKILEAFANERPVVTTSIGCEGLPVRDGEHLLVANTTETFADAVVSVLTVVPLASRIAKRGRALVEQCFDWSCVIDTAEEILRSD